MKPETEVNQRSLSFHSSVGTRSSHGIAGQPDGGRSHLDRESSAELRCAIERSLSDGGLQYSSHGVDAELRMALGVACARALLQRGRIEQLVIDLKQIWATIPTVRTTPDDKRLSSIITACINEYYDRSDRPAE